MHGNCVICRNCFFIPDIFINLIDGKYPALILYEKKQNIIFNWRKLQGFAIHLNFFLIVILNRSPSSRQLKKYKFFLPAEIYLLAVFMRLASKFRVFPLVLKFRDSFVSVYCYSNLYNLRSFLREYLYQ